MVINQKMISTEGVGYAISYSRDRVDPKGAPPDLSHIHNEIEIYLNIEGDVSFLVRNSIYPITRGDVILTRAGELHHCIYHSDQRHEHFCLWLSEGEERELLSFLGEGDANFIRFAEKEREELIQCFYRLQEAENRGERLWVCTEIMRILTLLRQGMRKGGASAEGAIPSELQTILDYIQTNYCEIANVSELCEIFFISPSTLNRRFSEYLHITPKAYLESVKLSAARRLLKEGYSVTDVCFVCGYCDSSHFIRAFRKKFHVTPRQFKMNIQKS